MSMDYETIYKRSIELAKYFVECGHLSQSDAEEMFPELAESEDEKIRKEIIFLLKHYNSEEELTTEYSIESMIEYLEKQKECSFSNFPKSCDDCPKEIQSAIDKEFGINGRDDNDSPLNGYGDWKKGMVLNGPAIWGLVKLGIELQKEQSFVYDGDNYQNAKEEAWNNFFGKNPSLKESKSVYSDGFSEGYQFGIHEEKPHKWTVHDEAVRKEAIACLEEWKSKIPPSADYENILFWLKEELPIHNEKQKEQKSRIDACGFPLREEGESACSYLERCLAPDMRNIWYEACSEIKEKQKEQKPTTVEKLRSISTPAEENWFEIQRKWEKEDEQKPAEWSEEDDACYELILRELEHYKEYHPDYFSRLIEWFTTRFKSLRPQPQWNPNKDQMFALDNAILMFHNLKRTGDKEGLESLSDDLKKL